MNPTHANTLFAGKPFKFPERPNLNRLLIAASRECMHLFMYGKRIYSTLVTPSFSLSWENYFRIPLSNHWTSICTVEGPVECDCLSAKHNEPCFQCMWVARDGGAQSESLANPKFSLRKYTLALHNNGLKRPCSNTSNLEHHPKTYAAQFSEILTVS